MGKFNTIDVIVFVLIAIAIVGVIANVVTNTITDKTQIDTLTVSAVQPGIQIDLSKTRILSIINVTNSTNTLIAATNYTLNISDESLRILDNGTNDATWGGDTWLVNYNHQDGVITGAGRVLTTLLTLFVMIGIVIAIIKKAGMRGTGR